jgi:hypothetical protein
MKQEIIRKALVLLGVNSGSLERSGTKTTKAENLCEEFAGNSIEETFLVAKWPFALKLISGINGHPNNFTLLDNVNDCMKVAVISPSNLEWYIEAEKFYFKGKRLDAVFYYSREILQHLIDNDRNYIQQVPESFRLLCSLSLVGQVGFALYSDSLFVESFRKQYILKLDEVRRIYSVDYNLVNSGEL